MCFQPHIIKPTRIIDHSATLIDNIFFNSLEHEVSSGNLLCDLTDHLPNFLIINDLSSSTYRGATYKRDYSQMDEEGLVAEVHSIDWDETFAYAQDINSIFEIFHTKINEVIDKYAPLKKLSKREYKLHVKPWVTKGIRVSIAEKNKIYKKYLKFRNDYYLFKFRHYRNKLKHLLLISKKQYYTNYFKSYNHNIKKTWRGIKQIISLKKQSFKVPHVLQIGSSKLTDKQSIVNAFNNYFASVGPELAAKIPSANSTFDKFMTTPLRNSFVLFPVIASEIELEINNLNASKSNGPFSIPTKLLKILSNLLSAPLAFLFNYCFTVGEVPKSFKIAKVIPINKKGSKVTMSNYRPISLLSIFSKIMEKLMYNKLIDYFQKNNVLFNGQFGFRASHSTAQAILLITDKIQNSIEKKLFSCGIFLDLSKAFDTVNHDILIQKLEYYGIRGLPGDWFRSYLTNRSQFVSIENTNSVLKSITCGVPQGSVLGPLLFLLYINDFCNCAPQLDFHLFADDTNLFCADKSLQDLEFKNE